VGMQAADYLTEIEKYLGVKPDCMIYNGAPFQESLLQKYIAEGNHVVENNCDDESCQVISGDIVSTQSFVSVSGDTIERSLIRHDAVKLAEVVMSLIKGA